MDDRIIPCAVISILGKKGSSSSSDGDDDARKKMAKVEWVARLPLEILELIADKIISLQDYIRLGCVCRDWHSIFLLNCHKTQKSKQNIPLLLLPPTEEDIIDSNFSTISSQGLFYSATKRRLLDYKIRLPLRKPKRFVGSSFGWLILIDYRFRITLFNPFIFIKNKHIGGTVHFHPPLITDTELLTHFGFGVEVERSRINHNLFICKAVLSGDPADGNDYVVAVVWGWWRKLAFIRPNDAAWYHVPNLQHVDDIIYNSSDSSFLVLLVKGPVVSICINDDYLKTNTTNTPVVIAPSIKSEPYPSGINYPPFRMYIVKSTRGGDLLQIRRFGTVINDRIEDDFVTTSFQVFRFIPELSFWVELKSLGDEILFLGDNSSVSVRGCDFFGCKPGSIYYTLVYRRLDMFKIELCSVRTPLDMGIFKLDTRQFYPYNIHLTARWVDAMFKQPPIWILPSVQAP